MDYNERQLLIAPMMPQNTLVDRLGCRIVSSKLGTRTPKIRHLVSSAKFAVQHKQYNKGLLLQVRVHSPHPSMVATTPSPTRAEAIGTV